MKNKKRLLFIGFNRTYVNRTFACLIRSLMFNFHIDFFGPGYQPYEILDDGPEAWIEKHGDYDAVLFDHYTIISNHIASLKNPFAGDVIQFSLNDFRVYAPKLKSFIEKFSGKKIFIANWDVYGIDLERIDYLDSLDCFVLDSSVSRETIEQRGDRFRANLNKSIGSKGFWYKGGNDNWINYMKQKKEIFLEVPHCIGLEEFCWTPLQVRRNNFSIPGTSYLERKNIYPLLSPSRRLEKFIIKVEDRVRYLSGGSLKQRQLNYIHSRYDREISECKMAFVSGGPFRYPVRKYFEIPALGTLPIGQTCEGFDDLGFTDGVNFIIAEELSEVKKIMSNLDGLDTQAIASESQRLVLDNHSEPARSIQLLDSFSRIIVGSFKGSYWSRGNYLHC